MWRLWTSQIYPELPYHGEFIENGPHRAGGATIPGHGPFGPRHQVDRLTGSLPLLR